MIFKPTFSQMSFYSGNAEIDSYLWNQGVMQLFSKKYSYEQLNDAYNKLVKTNDSLRIKIERTNQDFVMKLKEHKHKNYPHWTLSSEEELENKAREFLNEPIDLNGDLVKCAIFETPNVSGIMISGHHIVVDGYSVTVMTEHINHYLENPEYIPSASQKYIDYIEKEEKYRTTKRYRIDYDFWQKELKTNPSFSLFSDVKSTLDYCSSEINMPIAPEKIKQIKSLCKKENFSVQTFFNSVYAVYFQRSTGLSNFTFGVPVLNRTTNTELNTIGLYMHISPLIIKGENSSFLNTAQKIENSQLNLFRHQKFTQIEIKKILEETDVHINRLFDVITDFQEFNYNDSYEIRLPYSNFLSVPLEIHMQSFGNKKHNLKIRYRTSLFNKNEIQNMINSIIAITDDALKNPNKKIYNLDMISSAEKQKLLIDFNDTQHKYKISDNSTIYSLFEKTAKENEDKICIKTAEKNMSFGELLNTSERLDTMLRKITKDNKSVVVVISERSVEMYSAIYGIIRGGNAYLPIDPDYPQERIDYIIQNSKAVAAVVQGKFTDLVRSITCINMTELLNHSEDKTSDVPFCAAKPDDTAYVIYTSGSTGNPKGAKISHKSAVNRISWMHDKYRLDRNDVILQKTPYTFDVSVWEHFWWGMYGGSLAASKPGEHFLPAKILEEVYKNSVTHIHFVPSVFDLFLNYLENHPDELHKFNTVKYVFLSGEALSANLVQRFYKMFDYDRVTLHNLYGPAECAVDVTYYDCTPSDLDPVPIGKPIYNTQMYVIDKYNFPLPIGVTGELCIAGMNVGQGYLNNPDLTAEKFIENPFGEGKLYKTGDLAYWREDGQLIFCGRIDGQIKINGQRIEIGEIETIINSLDSVDSVAVIVKKADSKNMLVAFYTGKSGYEKEIRDFCLRKLPKYMVPAAVVHLDKIPLNQSGKADRKALTQQNFEIKNFVRNELPISETEHFVCEAFKSVLGEDNIGRNTNFFEIGGTSLSMISLLSEKGFENITAAEFMRAPTPAGVVHTMNEQKQNKPAYLEPLLVSEHPENVLILLPFAGGQAESYSNFIKVLKSKTDKISVYFIRYLHSFEECENAADEIATVLKEKKIMLYSHCVGSAVALQLIKMLENKNVPVKHYFAGASIPPAKPTEKNIWNKVPDIVLKKILSKAGAQLDSLSAKNISELLIRFRVDTDFANISFTKFYGKIKTPINLIMTKNDIFTLNYRQAKKIWTNYAEEVREISFINSKSHYFQSTSSEDLIRILLSKM